MLLKHNVICKVLNGGVQLVCISPEFNHEQCSNLYIVLKRKMGSEMTKPPGCPNVSGYHLIDMFNRALTERKKKEVLSMFGRKDTTLRLVIATTAFGTGVDIEVVQRIVHWRSMCKIGRCGRDGEASQSILYQAYSKELC